MYEVWYTTHELMSLARNEKFRFRLLIPSNVKFDNFSTINVYSDKNTVHIFLISRLRICSVAKFI